MIKVYSPPTEIEAPVPDFRKSNQERIDEEKAYLDKLRNYVKERNPHQDLVGETVKFPMADGYARYMVAASKPMALIHLPLGDAWHYEYVVRLTKKDIEQEIKGEKLLNQLFNRTT